MILNASAVRDIRAALERHLQDFDFEGGRASIGKCSYLDSHATFQITVSMPNDKGVVESKEASDYKKLGGFFGLKLGWLNKSFKMGAHTYKIVGLDPKRHKRCVVLLKGAKRFIASPENVKVWIDRK